MCLIGQADYGMGNVECGMRNGEFIGFGSWNAEFGI